VAPADHDPRSEGLPGEPAPGIAPPGRRVDRLAMAVLLSGLATLMIGWVAYLISGAGVAPAVLFPIGVGLAVGAAQMAILWKLKLSLPRFGAAALAVVWGALAVATEDYSGYRDYLGQHAAVQRGDRLASVVQAASDQWKPAGFPAYLSAVVRRNPIWWSIDAVLTPLAATVLAGVTSRRSKPPHPN
jgi:hypothetical protein